MTRPKELPLWDASKLRTVYLSPTNVCNYSCVMCFNQMVKTERGFLDGELFRRIIDDLAEIRGQRDSEFSELHFYLDGEPFLHKEYVEMLGYIDSSLSGIRVIISTNAALMTPEKVDEILKLNSNRYVFILSLDASNEALYKAIKPRSHFSAAEENARYFLRRKIDRRVSNPYAVLQFIVMSINEGDMNDFYWRWESMVGPETKASYSLWTERMLNENSSHIYWKRFHSRSNPFEVSDPLYSDHFGQSGEHRGQPKICSWPWRVLTIGWDGRVHPCCFFPEFESMLGNIQGNSIREFFSGAQITQMRELFLDGKVSDIPICKSCDRKSWWHDKGLEDLLGV